jgi:hypothetical protein
MDLSKPICETKDEKLKKRFAKMKLKQEERIAKLKDRIKKKPKPKAQISLITLRKTAWKLFSKIVREEEKYVCYTCGKDMSNAKSSADAGHYIPQSKGNVLRFDRRNVHCQCTSCNQFLHGNLSTYALKLEAQYGHGILQEFEEIKNQRKKFTREELEGMIVDYKSRLQTINDWNENNLK